MENDIRYASVNASIARAMIRAMGMTAENEQRKAVGHSMAYTEDSFLLIIEEEVIGYNSVIMQLRD